MVPVFLRSRNRERDSAEKFTPEMSYRKLLEVKKWDESPSKFQILKRVLTTTYGTPLVSTSYYPFLRNYKNG